MIMFLRYDGITLTCDHQELIVTIIDVAAGRLHYDDLLDFIRHNSVPMDQ